MTFVVQKGTTIKLDMNRKVNKQGVMWYEWNYMVLRNGKIEMQSGWFNQHGSKYRVSSLT
jgi:hypothetical protein